MVGNAKTMTIHANYVLRPRKHVTRLLPEYKLTRFQVLLKIKLRNKRLETEMGRPVAESR